MAAEQNKAVVRQYVEEVLDKANLAVLDELMAEDAVNRTSHRLSTGTAREGVRRAAGVLRSAFPDLHISVEDQLAEGDRVATRLQLSGTHQGTFQGAAPTGTHVIWTAIRIDRLADGKIAEYWEETDRVGLFQQLGGVPAQEQGARPTPAR
jgi:predicted ester cyclase